MFTGIVEELGTVAAIEDQGDALRLTVRATTALDGTILGDSIAAMVPSSSTMPVNIRVAPGVAG